MAKKSKLLSALDAHKGRNFATERQAKLQKSAAKKKRLRAEKEEEEIEETGELVSLWWWIGCGISFFLIFYRSRKPMARQ